ncbi:MAG: hypothetical protein ACRD59_19045 [Candidatus Acidiferrales bacterium]
MSFAAILTGVTRFPFRSILLILLALTLSAAGTRAQNAKKPSEKSAGQPADPALSAENSVPAAPQPSPEMQSVAKALAGKWSVKIKFEPGDDMPQGAEGYGEEVWRTGPGGFTIMEEADDRTPFGEVFLTGFTWWDTKSKSFRGMLCTSQNPRGCDPQGSLSDVHLSWDGKQFIVDIDSQRDGKKTLWHEVFFDITPTSFTQTGESGEAGGPLKRVVTIHATRVPDSPK